MTGNRTVTPHTAPASPLETTDPDAKEINRLHQEILDMTQLTGPLTPKQTERLVELEGFAQKSFQIIGMALREIRDNKLYRETHSTFETYCEERWGITYRRVNQLIVADEVSQNLGTIVPESHARVLAVIEDSERQREVYQLAVKTAPDGNLTAAHIKETVEAMEAEAAAKQDPALGKARDMVPGEQIEEPGQGVDGNPGQLPLALGMSEDQEKFSGVAPGENSSASTEKKDNSEESAQQSNQSEKREDSSGKSKPEISEAALKTIAQNLWETALEFMRRKLSDSEQRSVGLFIAREIVKKFPEIEKEEICAG
jgi:hypothetical protein